MLAPIAPHFASELWSHFIQIENRINTNSLDINWNENVLEQQWPEVDAEYELNLEVKVIIKLQKKKKKSIILNCL